jgi:hypothetical protein
MRVVVATHGHCFDGVASAVLFTYLLQRLEGGNAEYVYRACGYGPGQKPHDDQLFVGDVNALLDYRFSPTPALTWYFDHHRTAFASTEAEAVFESRRGEGKFFFDAGALSCTRLISTVAREQFGVTSSMLDELVAWADIIDSASFPSPEAAIDYDNSLLRLASVIEHHADDKLLARLVPDLLAKPVAHVASSSLVSELAAPLARKRESFIQQVRTHAEQMGRVVFVDLTAATLETIGKFVTYALYPRSAYSVIVGRLGGSVKISIGHNPWGEQALDTDISAICARYGGGGHPMVGGISFKSSEADRAVEVARSIAKELNVGEQVV